MKYLIGHCQHRFLLWDQS